jgi:hypothetical protein
MMQAFAYHHLVPAQELKLDVGGLRRGGIPLRLEGGAVKIIPGRAAKVQVTGPRGQFFSQLQLELSEPPEGIALGKVAALPQGLEFELRCDAKVKPGMQGNLIVNAYPGRGQLQAGRARPGAPPTAPGTLPAIPFEVVAQE